MQGDVLSNLNIDDVADIMGGRVQLACAFVATVKVGCSAALPLRVRDGAQCSGSIAAGGTAG